MKTELPLLSLCGIYLGIYAWPGESHKLYRGMILRVPHHFATIISFPILWKGEKHHDDLSRSYL